MGDNYNDLTQYCQQTYQKTWTVQCAAIHRMNKGLRKDFYQELIDYLWGGLGS